MTIGDLSENSASDDAQEVGGSAPSEGWAVATFLDNTTVARMGPERLTERLAEGIVVNDGLAGTDSFLSANGPAADLLGTPKWMEVIRRGFIVPLVRDGAPGLLHVFDEALRSGTHARDPKQRPYIEALDAASARTSKRWSGAKVRRAYEEANDRLFTHETLVALGLTPEDADLVVGVYLADKALWESESDLDAKKRLDVYTNTWVYNRFNPDGNNRASSVSASAAATIWRVARVMYLGNVPGVLGLPMALADDVEGLHELRILRAHLRQSADFQVERAGSPLAAANLRISIADPAAAWLFDPSTLRRLDVKHFEAIFGISQAREFHAARRAYLGSQNSETAKGLQATAEPFFKRAALEVAEMFIRDNQFKEPADIALRLIGDQLGLRLETGDQAGVLMAGLPGVQSDPFQIAVRHFDVPIIERQPGV